MTKTCVICKKQPISGDLTRSFHSFPKNTELKQKWMEMIGIKHITKVSTVCSDHFRDESYHQTDGYTRIRRLLSTAVPVLYGKSSVLKQNTDNTNKPSSIEEKPNEENEVVNRRHLDHFVMTDTSENNMEMFDNTEESECTIELVPHYFKEESNVTQNRQWICRVCLVTNVKLYFLRNELLQQYQDITGLKPSNEDNLPQYICWECAQRLGNCHRFKSRAVLAHCLLTGLLENDKIITESNITKIDRRKNGLESVLMRNTKASHLLQVKRLQDVVIGNRIHDNIILIVQNPEVKPHVDLTTTVNLRNRPQLTNTIKLEGEIKKEKEEFVLETDSDNNLNRIDDNNELDCNDKDSDDSSDEYISESKKYIKIPASSIKETKPCRRVTRNTKMTVSTAKTKSRPPKMPKEETKEEIKKVDRKMPFRRPQKIASEIENLEKFDVIKLSVEEQIQMIEKRKETDNYKLSPYKCDKCYKGFMDHEAFKIHIIRHTNEVGEYECPMCKIHVKSNYRLNEHMMMHCHKYACKQCSFVTMGRHTAQLHVKYHKGVVYKCPHCPEQFTKSTSYLSHLRIKHPSNNVCDLCGFSFVSQKGLIQHKKLKHRFDEVDQTQEQHTCEFCGVVLATESAFRTHMEVSHQGDESERNSGQVRFKKSDDDTARTNRLVRYRKVHKGPIQCEQCDAQLPNAMAYHQHFRRHHRGVNRTRFPTQQFMCEVCGRMLQSRSQLMDHSFVHTNVKQFQCPICNKTFQRKNRLLEHIRRHNSKPSHRCGECGKNFSTRGNMMRHAFEHTGLHLKKPWPKRNREKRNTPNQEPEPLNHNMEM